jgi:hypothetical protein
MPHGAAQANFDGLGLAGRRDCREVTGFADCAAAVHADIDTRLYRRNSWDP